MKVEYNEEKKLFHLYNKHLSYVIGILRNGHLGHFYLGKRLYGPLSEDLFRRDQGRAAMPYVYEGDMGFSLNLERQEYPSYGTTDFRSPAIDIIQKKGSRIVDFKYDLHRIIQGKPPLEGLPSTRVSNTKDAMTLEIDLVDMVLDLKLTLCYTVFPDLPVVARSVRLENMGLETFNIDRIMSLSIDLFDDNWEWTQLSGDWARERYLRSVALRPGIQSIGSLRGASSAQHNPFVMLKRPETREESGEAIGISLVYSGNFLLQGEVNSDGVTRLISGINPEGFSWNLKSKEVFQTPEAIIAYSGNGIGPLSRTFHDLFHLYLIPEKWQKSPRPVLINNWEATYFNFNEEKILSLAKSAKSLGIELFVLDDGWFGSRNNDTQGLGDWFVNTKKLPGGIAGIAEKIESMGMKFGLWIEPEMVNKDTEFFKCHPDWLIGDPKRTYSHQRNQYVLDFSRKEVVDAIFDQLTKVLDDVPISYIKWDMNRNITEPFSSSLTAEKQGELFHRYILGVYNLYERLINRYPDILFESCASGGGRFDPGLLYYAPQTWTSDNTDAIERLKIQYGTSMVYPISSMGSHVSAVPNHQVLREAPLKIRGDVAYFGTFGYELDLTILSEEEMSEIRKQVEFFKEYRSLIHHGSFYRLLSPFENSGNETAWMVVSKDRSEAIVGWYQILANANRGLFKLKLTGLDSKKMYQISDHKEPISGSILMDFGILMNPAHTGLDLDNSYGGDYQSRIWTIKAV